MRIESSVMEIKLLGGSVSIDDTRCFLKQLSEIADLNDVKIQAFNAKKIAGEAHIRYSIDRALSAIENNRNVARDTGVEIMRYASGKRQIGEAFSMGVYKGDMDILLLIMGESHKQLKNAVEVLYLIITPGEVVAYSDEKKEIIMEQFDITPAELEATGQERIKDLVIERVSLVDILK